MLNLKLQSFGHVMWRTNSVEKTLMLEEIEGRKRRWQQRMRWLDVIINSVDMNFRKLWVIVKDRKSWDIAVHRFQRVRHDLVNEQQWKVMFMCSAKSFEVLAVTFRSMIHFKLSTFLCMVWGRDPTSFQCLWISSCPRICCWKDYSFPLLNYFATLIDDQWTISVRAYFYFLILK